MLLSMYRITLTDDQRQDLRQRTRQAGIAPSLRDRLEMVRLSDAGWSVPPIAPPGSARANRPRLDHSLPQRRLCCSAPQTAWR